MRHRLLVNPGFYRPHRGQEGGARPNGVSLIVEVAEARAKARGGMGS